MANNIRSTRDFVARKIGGLLASGNEAATKAALANLRRGIGKAPGAMPELWGLTLDGLPEELMSKYGEPTRGEWASYTALTLFALHQQGNDPKTQPMNAAGMGLGKAVRMLVKDQDDAPRVKRRFDAAVTADSPSEFSYHVRGLIQLLKANGIPLDYADLAEDLYKLQIDEMRDGVRLKWGRDFYRVLSRDEQNDRQE